MLRIQCASPIHLACPCCGETSIRLTRFVYQHGQAWAVYHARFTPTHPETVVKMLITIGIREAESGPDPRHSFALVVRAADPHIEVMVSDASAIPWADAEPNGRRLNRAQALDHPWLSQAFLICDHAVLEDHVLARYLDPGFQPRAEG